MTLHARSYGRGRRTRSARRWTTRSVRRRARGARRRWTTRIVRRRARGARRWTTRSARRRARGARRWTTRIVRRYGCSACRRARIHFNPTRPNAPASTVGTVPRQCVRGNKCQCRGASECAANNAPIFSPVRADTGKPGRALFCRSLWAAIRIASGRGIASAAPSQRMISAASSAARARSIPIASISSPTSSRSPAVSVTAQTVQSYS